MGAPVFLTGGTGYIGGFAIAALLAKRYSVHALVRPGPEHKVPHGSLPVVVGARSLPFSFGGGSAA